MKNLETFGLPQKGKTYYDSPHIHVTELLGTSIMAISHTTTEHYTEKPEDSFFYEEPESGGGNFFIDF